MRQARLLLADDNPAILEIVVQSLQTDFVIAGTFTDGHSVLREFARLSPDVIILDISMDDLSGFEVARRLKEMNCQAKLIFLTVHEDLDFVQAAFAMGAAAYVFKSEVHSNLIPAIHAVLTDSLFYPKVLAEDVH